MARLVVALDAVAALRAATGGVEPRLTAAATLAELAGAEAVRIGVHEALRPVDDEDLRDLRRTVGTLELRLAPRPGLMGHALDVRPDRVVLAGEPVAGSLEPVPLEAREAQADLAPAVRNLREAGLVVTASIVPEIEAVKAAHSAGVAGVELFTGRVLELPARERAAALEQLADAARLAAKLRIPVALGGGLDVARLPELRTLVPVAERVAVGRGLVARAALLGFERAVRDLLAVLA